jgi:pantoate--beta-alanine ligase
MRAWTEKQRRAGKTIGLVPTMGALHEGHASLMRAAVRDNDVAVLSIFVNPTQFGPNEDYEEYPRTFEADCRLAADIGIAALYAPDARTMYPDKYATFVEVERLTQGLCGRSRPTHFRGVTTVVTKLFNAVRPDRAYFGQKDAQQCAVIRRMTRDLDFGIEIVELPIVRKPDGLAISSRNRHLTPEEHQRALALSRALLAGHALLEAGERDPQKVIEAAQAALSGLDVDYVELVQADEMQPVGRVAGKVLLAAAVRMGATRLIDNIKYEVPDQ